MIIHYPWQPEVGELTAYSDSDWAGCRKTGKNTSGGIILRGKHMLKSWSSTQRTVALSSGEAELTAMVKATAEGLGLRSLWREWGQPVGLEVYGDSNAALGIVRRRGAGKLRHVRIGNLWLQDMRDQEEVDFKKVSGKVNPADGWTKGINAEEIERYGWMLGCSWPGGRAELAPQVAE